MSIPLLSKSSNAILLQLDALLAQLDQETYSQALSLLNGNSLGKHVRHILEVYQELYTGLAQGKVCYDARQRDIQLEQDPNFARRLIVELIKKTDEINKETGLSLFGNYGEEEVIVGSTFGRELAYNIEHAIHHMAILQICLRNQFPFVVIPDNFGLAYSTIEHQSKHVHTQLPT
jgi:uncharacterized damage-inducible protein DinB